ncbi:alpha/beta fold hydrolase [Heyndrickxia acidicola]|uniref:Alpha/beta hydrolase n=1 Tax=Heyndrickxia acidicola TaxID=209389 RepID=A0ABU6MEQ7_9BACI|nr:alpha/beta hydrolase [Heyndrickxia acidicola]MED1201540.1 alpha/beta hydrolase [Heyndrickxia acidicola]
MPYVQHDDRRLFYEIMGSGVPILFIHPPGMGRKTFQKQESLQAFYRLIFMDLSGHGESSCPQRLTLQTFIDDVEAIRSHLNIENFYLFAYSAGGIVAQEYAIQFRNRVKGLMLSGGYPKVMSKRLEAEHHIGIWMAEKHPVWLSRLLSYSHFSEKERQKEIFQQMLKTDPQVWMQFYQISLQYDCLDRISSIKARMMLLYGTQADSVNYHARFYPNIIDTEIIFIPHAEHQLPTRKSLQVNQFIDQFIKNQELFNDKNIM